MFRFFVSLSIASFIAGIVLFPFVHWTVRGTKDPDAYEFGAWFVSILLVGFAVITGSVFPVWRLRSKQERDLRSSIKVQNGPSSLNVPSITPKRSSLLDNLTSTIGRINFRV